MLKLRNTLTRQIEEIRPREPGRVLMYTCGPTVYRDVHIGNLRSYLLADWIRRACEHSGFSVSMVKNITDVGHMRQEMLEQGEDRVIAEAVARGVTPGEIAAGYTAAFLRDERRLNILPAAVFPRATEHVPEMITIIQRLLDTGYAYQSGGNVYFRVSAFEAYGQLSGNQQNGMLAGARTEIDPLKKDIRDFTLWKAAEPGRELKWDSPWGDGFPGWHIECSAMSRKYLGERLDIHTGGVDNIFPHHEDERAQSEAAFGSPYVGIWVHGQHLLADGVKMAKSAGNSFTLDDLAALGYDPLSFRYLCLTARYRTRLNFTFTSLKASERALTLLRRRVGAWAAEAPPVLGEPAGGPGAAVVDRADVQAWRKRFWNRVEDDLDLPGALATLWDIARSDLLSQDKLRLALEFDEELGLDMAAHAARPGRAEPDAPPAPVRASAARHTTLRQARRYGEADQLRRDIAAEGWKVDSTLKGVRLYPLTQRERSAPPWRTISSSSELSSLLDRPAGARFTVAIQANGWLEDVQRCVTSVLKHGGGADLQLLVLDNSQEHAIGEWLEAAAGQDRRFEVVHADVRLGEGSAKNLLIRRSIGRFIVFVETHIEVTGNLLDRLEQMLAPEHIGAAGPFGLCTDDLRHFHEDTKGSPGGEVDAMQAYCFGVKRIALQQVGLLPRSYRFYRNLDLELSFRLKDRGYRILCDASLPVAKHEHRAWTSLGDDERDRLSKQNFGRFLRRWGKRVDLLVKSQRT